MRSQQPVKGARDLTPPCSAGRGAGGARNGVAPNHRRSLWTQPPLPYLRSQGARGTLLRSLGSIALALCCVVANAQTAPYVIDNDGISNALTTQAGDASRGREIASNRQIGMCVLCHHIPDSSDKFQGDIATPLAGAGLRWSVPQLRLRVIDSRRVNVNSIMPAYHKIEGLSRVGAAWRDKPMLNAQQVEDVVAWLATLK